MQKQILAAVTRGLLRSIEGRGVDPGTFLQKAGLSAQAIADPDGWVGITQHIDVGRAIMSTFPGQNLGLQTGARIFGDPRGALGYVLRRSERQWLALKNFCSFLRVVNQSMVVELSLAPERTSVEFHMVPELAAVAHPAEALMAAWMAISRHITSSAWCPEEVIFCHAPQGDTREHEKFFGSPVHFRGSTNRLVLPSSAWGLPISVEPHDLDSVFEPARNLAVEVAEGGVQTRAVDAIASRLTTLPLDVTALGPGESLLARLAFGYGLLKRSSLFVHEIAYLLGFDDLRSLEESFVSRFNVHPRELRAAAA